MTADKASPATGLEPARSPKVLFGEDNASVVVSPSNSAVAPKVLFGSAQPPRPKGDGPRILASGEVRRRIPCSAESLLEVDRVAPASVVEQALRVVAAANLDDHHFDDVVRFGAALQSEHGRLAEDELNLVGHEALVTAKRLGAELLQCLDDLDPERVFSVRGGMLQAIRALSARRDPAANFTNLYPRVQALAQELGTLEAEIHAVARRLRAIAKRYAALDRSLAAHILAGRFLIHHVGSLQLADPERQAHFTSQADAIETRVASLAATKAMIDVNRRTLDVAAGNVDGLAAMGQGFLNEDLPAWHTAYAAALLAVRNSAEPRAGLLSSLNTIHARILRKLKSEG